MTPQEQENRARSRFILLTVLRASGVALMLMGMGIMATRMIEPADFLGGLIFIAGMIDSLVVPPILARKWRTPPGA